jgi:hypothetical protein
MQEMQIQHSCRSGHLNRRRETVDSKDEEIRQLVIYNQTSIELKRWARVDRRARNCGLLHIG